MAYLDDLKKELKKRNISYGTEKTGAAATETESFISQLNTELRKRGLIGGLTEDEKYPLLTDATVKETRSEPFLELLKKPGNLDDGYQFGDVAKMILGTAGDSLLQVGKGALGMAEGLGDVISYGVAALAEKAGVKKGAQNIRKAAMGNSVEELTSGADEWLGNYSVLGKTTEAVAQGLGQIGVLSLTGGAGLGAVGQNAFTLGTMGLSSVGSGMSEAYNNGATDSEAMTYGIISGAAEALSEMMFGGLGKGVNALGFNKGLLGADDLLAKKASSIFKSQLMKNVAELGVKAAGEGLEEVVSGVAQSIGKKLTYMDEESLGKILKDENLLEQFIVGGITSAIAQTPSMVKHTKAGVDIVTGQTKNEQTVIEHEVKSRIEAQEKETGKKVTGKEKSAIRARVEQDLERGYISTDSIEQALGGEDWKAYKDAASREKAVADELQELGKKKDATLEEQTRYKDLLEQDKANKENGKAEALKRKLSEKVSKMAMQDRVGEAYNENYRRGQAFQADVNRYDEKYRSTIQNAIDSGILNNTNRSHEFVELVAKISGDTGSAFDFANSAKLKESGFAIDGKTVNGVVTPDRVLINVDSAKALNTVVGHEVTHILEGTELYDGLKDALFKYAKGKGEFFPRRAELAELYEGVEGADIDGELVADLVGDYLFTDEGFIRELSTAHRNVFQKLFDEIKHLCKLATAGSKEARELEKVKQAFEKVYRDAGQATKNTADGGGVKYSIEETADGKKFVRADRQVIYGNDADAWSNQVEDYINSQIRKGGDVSFVAENGDVLTITKNTAGKLADNHTGHGTTMSDDAFYLKANAAVHIDELAQSSIKGKTKADHGSRHGDFASKGWNYRTAYFQDFDGKYYRLQISVAQNADGNVVYNIGNIEKRSSPAIYGSSGKAGALGGKTSSMDSISNSGENVNTQYSLSSAESTKQKQLDIINETNPAPNSYSTWIRSAEDIKTLAETLQDSDWAGETEFNPDLSKADIERAIENGKITVYSSYPIENGVFVSPSAMEAGSYSGNGMLYEKTVNIEDVAWIDPTQGQFAQVRGENTQTVPLEERLSGDELLDAQDLMAEIEGVADITPEGYVTVYHRTSESNAKRIMRNGKMTAKEDGIFFSTQKNGEYASGYGNSVIEMKIPVEKLVLDDIFDTEAHLRIPLENRNQVLDVSDYLVQSEKFSLSPEGEGGGGASDGYRVYGGDVRLSMDEIAPTLEEIARMEAEKVKSQAPGDLEAQLEAAKQAYEDAARESDILFDKYNRGEITDQEFQSRYKEMERRLLALENQRDYLQNEVDQNARADSYIDEDIPADPKWEKLAQETTKQTKTTKPVAESKPIIAKKELRSTIMGLFSTADGTKNEVGSVIDSYADQLLRKGSLTEADRKAFFERMYESGMVTVAADEYYQQARQYIKGGRIYVDQNTILELGDDWGAIRRKAFANGIYLTSDSKYRNAGIDTWNRELSTELPGLFSSEETDFKSILEQIIHVAEMGKEQKMSLAEYTESLAGKGFITESEVIDNLERRMDEALRTFAEKAKLEIKLRDRTGVKIAQERQARAEAQQRARSRKELSELQQKTMKSLQWLNKNRNRAPAELKAKYDEVLSDIDIYAVGAANEMRWSSKYEATYQDLAQMYQDAKTSDPNFLPSKELERIVARLNNRKIADMDIDALNDLYKAATALRTEFYNRNNVINDDMHRLFSEVYAESKTEIENAPGKYSGKMLDKLLNMDQLTPMNVLQRMAGWNPNSTFYSMAKQLEKGTRDERAYRVKAARRLETFLTENRELVSRMDGQGKNAIWYEIEVPELSQLRMGDKPIFGENVKIKFTPSQKIHMYLESKNADNLRHMTGGRTFADPKLYSQGKRQEAFAQGMTVRLAPETVKQIVSDLTPKELELAGILEKYYNVFAKDEINKVSNPLYGYDKAMGNYYAPIVSNQNYTQTQFGEFDVKAENVGHLKGRNYSKNPSYNISCFDAFERHVDQTARFVGMAIPTRNWQALMNWQSGGKSTADVITHKWGQEGKKYIEDLITDLQGGKGETTESVSSGVSKIESNYISAVFGANPSIVLKQLGSIPLAGTYLGMKNFPSVSQIRNIDTDLIGIYTPDLQWRTMGYSMPETKTLKESQNWTQKNKVVEFTLGGGAITAMDGWAASTLWPWAENKVRREQPNLEIGTSEQIQKGESLFYKAVAAEFENAVARSQSTSEGIYQSTLRKSNNAFAKAFTMFRSDSAQTYNAIRQKFGEYQYYARQGSTDAAKKAKSCIGTAVATALGGYMWAEGIELLMNLWKHKGKKYRDDDDELTAESIAMEVGIGLVGDMAGIVVGGEEISELIGNVLTGEKWYGIDTMGMEQLNDFFEGIANAGSGIRDLVAEGGNILDQGGDLGEYFSSHSKDILGGAKDLAEVAATYLGGVPVTNLEAYLLGLVKWVSPELNTAYEDALESVKKSDLSGLTGGSLTVRVESVLSERNIDASDKTAKTLAGLYEAGYKTAIPSNAPTSISIDGEAVQLSAYEQQLYGNIWSNAVSGVLDELTCSQAFTKADQKTQAKIVNDLYSYATERAKAGVAEKYEMQSGTAKAAAVSKAVPLAQYMAIRAVSNGMESDKDGDGNTVTGSKKKKVVAYINDLDDLEYGEKIILYRSLYSGDDSYNGEIVEYLNDRTDISYEQMAEILLALNFKISDDGSKVYWD